MGVFKAILLLVSLLQLECFTLTHIRTDKYHLRTLCQVHDEIYHDFHGPIGDFADIEGACTLSDIGLTLLVGKSTINREMKGLFITINDDTDEVFIPRASVICGYAKGVLTESFMGDKTVGYRFKNKKNIIVFEKQIMPLSDCISIISNRTNALSTSIAGHFLDEDGNILPTMEYKRNYFVPDNICDFSVGRLGMYANDFNIDDKSTRDNNYYTKKGNYFSRKQTKRDNASSKNTLSLVWRMEWDDSKKYLLPTWPVVITNKNMRFSNTEPIEVGLDYGRQYWQEHLK